MNEENDSDLVRRFQKGDIAAFEQFIQSHQQRLYRLAVTFLYDHSQAEDAVQEVFIRAYRGLPRFQFRSEPFSWLYRTLKNVCSEMNKKTSKTRDSNKLDEPLYEPFEQLQQERQLAYVINKLPQLSRRERDVVLLRVFEEFSEKETATILGVRKGTVKTLLHRGLKKLQDSCGPVIEL